MFQKDLSSIVVVFGPRCWNGWFQVWCNKDFRKNKQLWLFLWQTWEGAEGCRKLQDVAVICGPAGIHPQFGVASCFLSDERHFVCRSIGLSRLYGCWALVFLLFKVLKCSKVSQGIPFSIHRSGCLVDFSNEIKLWKSTQAISGVWNPCLSTEAKQCQKQFPSLWRKLQWVAAAWIIFLSDVRSLCLGWWCFYAESAFYHLVLKVQENFSLRSLFLPWEFSDQPFLNVCEFANVFVNAHKSANASFCVS